jgi:EAL domain-containing protein (putative c-di-GMP-specific phosphodiesterase class I)/GGDEF domain-containing protein
MFSFIRNEKPKFDWMYLGIFLIVVLVQGFVGLIVYATGGTTFVYPYFMFFPVIVGGFIFGPYIGLLFGLIGGLILGPAMPLLVQNHVPQAPQNWLIRIGFLSTAGGLVGTLRNFLIENFRKREEYLTIDPFTKLPNRNSFISLLEDELREKSSYSVMLVEIKNQDDIVAAFGFDFFSQLIQFLDPELRRVLKLDKPIFSIRLNLIGFGLYKNHDWYARQLIEFFKKPLIIQEIPIFCDVALGISDYPSDAATPMELVQKGLLALDEAKKKNKPFQILSSREARLLPVIQLVSQIDEAIRKGELDFDYQPILSSKNLSPNSIEALVRWTHHEYGLISPSEYIDYLESTNLVNELTYWSIELNTQRIKELVKFGIPLQMAINISPTNLMQEDFVRRVDGIIKNSQVDPSLITFEITERGLVTSYDEALLSLSQLHDLGIKISIDDFGAGNTSIDSFSKTKIDTLKIDQTFTKNIIQDETNRKIVLGLINLAASVGIETIAEGVETLSIYEELKSLNVDYVQGYYFFKPMDLTKATAWLKTYKGTQELQ